VSAYVRSSKNLQGYLDYKKNVTPLGRP
jgi:hypothetical protein